MIATNDRCLARQDDRAFGHVAKLTDVARPVVGAQRCDRVVREQFLLAAAELSQEVLGEQGNVLATVPQGWRGEHEAGEAEEKVAAKAPLAHHEPEVAVVVGADVLLARETRHGGARLPRLCDDDALELDRMAAVWPARAAMRALAQICVHECNCRHKFRCPLRGAILSDGYPEEKTAVGGRL